MRFFLFNYIIISVELQLQSIINKTNEKGKIMKKFKTLKMASFVAPLITFVVLHMIGVGF